jgi:hypothetical protein
MNRAEWIKLLHNIEEIRRFYGWLPDAAELLATYNGLTQEQQQRLAEYASVLEQYLAEQDQECKQPIFLILACLSVAALRGSSDPLALFAPNQVGFTAGKQKQAKSWIERASSLTTIVQQLDLPQRQHLIEYGGMLDVSIAAERLNSVEDIFTSLAGLTPKLPHFADLNEQLLTAYRVLSDDEGHQLALYAIERLAINGKAALAAEDILLRLACFVPGSLQGIHQHLVKLEMFYPGELYRGADAAARDQLIELVEQDHKNRNHLLIALAWIGDETVQQRFAEWQQSPPEWSSSLHVPPSDYTLEAGWFLTKARQRQNVYSNECYELIESPSGAASNEDEPVQVITPHPGKCGWCGRQLVCLFDFNLSDSRLNFLGLSGLRLRIAMCERCTCFAPIFTEFDTQGNLRWSSENQPLSFNGNEDDGWTLPQQQLVLGNPRRTPFEAHPFVLEEGASQIGGYPSWLQDAEYPKCPKCSQPMLFVGQVQTSDLGEPAEGVTYAFLCSDCGIAASNYQQT